MSLHTHFSSHIYIYISPHGARYVRHSERTRYRSVLIIERPNQSIPREILILDPRTREIRQPAQGPVPHAAARTAAQVQLEEVAHERLHDLPRQPLDLVHLALEPFQVLARVERVRGRGRRVQLEEALQLVVRQVGLGRGGADQAVHAAGVEGRGCRYGWSGSCWVLVLGLAAAVVVVVIIITIVVGIVRGVIDVPGRVFEDRGRRRSHVFDQPLSKQGHSKPVEVCV